MKYLKTYESILNKEAPYSDDDIKRGDYALFHYDKMAEYAYHYKLTPELKAFINDNSGIVQSVSDKQNNWIDVKYEDIPDSIKYKFSQYDTIMLQKDAMVDFAPTKEELEAKISSTKFNL